MGLVKAKKERIPQYDLMRAVAMFLVVYVHSSFMFTFSPGVESKHAGLYWFTSVIALVCNHLFFMVSGKFNLAQARRLEIGGYRTFYIKKIIDLLLPIALYAVAFWILRFVGIRFLGAWDDGTGFWDFVAFLKTTYQLLISSWWFIPMIFSLMIVTPFLGRMLGSLKKNEIYVLLVAIFGCAAIVAIEGLVGVTTILSRFLAPVFGVWAGVYILGYTIDKMDISPKLLLRWYVAAGSLAVIVGLIFVFAPQQSLSPSGDPLPTVKSVLSAVFYPVIGSALFLFFKNIKISGNRTKKAVEFVGNRAYGIYLIHFCFYFSYLQLLPEWLRGADDAVSGIANRMIITLVVYLASLIVATVVDLYIVNPIQKQLRLRFLKA